MYNEHTMTLSTAALCSCTHFHSAFVFGSYATFILEIITSRIKIVLTFHFDDYDIEWWFVDDNEVYPQGYAEQWMTIFLYWKSWKSDEKSWKGRLETIPSRANLIISFFTFLAISPEIVLKIQTKSEKNSNFFWFFSKKKKNHIPSPRYFDKKLKQNFKIKTKVEFT